MGRATEPLTFRGCRVANTAEQLAVYRELNKQAAGLLAAVTDGPSYDEAVRELRLRFDAHGIGLNHLPSDYSPQLVRSLAAHCAETASTLQALARENAPNMEPIRELETR